MVHDIEIRNDGSVICDDMQIGAITFSAPFPGEFWGYWFSDDASEGAQGRAEELSDEVEALASEAEDLREDLKEAEGRATTAEGDLSALMDEVRAFLSGGTYCVEAVNRLKAALNEAGG